MTAPMDMVIIFVMKSACRSGQLWSVVEKQLNRTCDQLQVLHCRIETLRIRQQRYANNGSCNSSSHCLQMELQVVEGVYAVYYKYGEMKAGQLMELDRGIDRQDDRTCGRV